MAGFHQGLSETGYVVAATWRSSTAGRTITSIACAPRIQPADFPVSVTLHADPDETRQNQIRAVIYAIVFAGLLTCHFLFC
jgi:hypothetical protein